MALSLCGYNDRGYPWRQDDRAVGGVVITAWQELTPATVASQGRDFARSGAGGAEHPGTSALYFQSGLGDFGL